MVVRRSVQSLPVYPGKQLHANPLLNSLAMQEPPNWHGFGLQAGDGEGVVTAMSVSQLSP